MTGVIVVTCAVQVSAVVVAGIKLVGIPQPKPMYLFSPNFQGMFTSRGSRADLGFGRYQATAVAIATLLRFFGLKLCGCSTAQTPAYIFTQLSGYV